LLVLLDSLPIGPNAEPDFNVQDFAAAHARALGYQHATLSDFPFQQQIAPIVEVAKNIRRLKQSFVPKRFDGNVFLFASKDSEIGHATEAWRPHIGGQIKVHSVECTHETMMDPIPLQNIGNVIASESKALQTDYRLTSPKKPLSLKRSDA
jgi:thioesterase domain-containing protein